MTTRLIAGAVTAVFAIIAALVVLFVSRGSTHATTYEVVLTRARAATSQLANSIGPNTTLHEVVLLHRNHPVSGGTFALPADSQTETWMAFGADGDVVAMYAVTTDGTGKVYQTQVFTPSSNTLVTTDLTTGKTTTLSHYTAPGAAARVAAAFNDAITKVTNIVVEPGAAAITAPDANGVLTYTLTTSTNRSYIDRSSYRVIQSDQLAPDGSVTESSQYPVLESINGNVVPTTTPLATQTDRPMVATATTTATP